MTNLKKNMMNFKPMLAHPVSKKIEYDQTLFIQPKLDGVRCYITADGAFSRNNKQFYNCKHILTELKPLFASNPYLILDGELYNHKFKNNFNKIISLVRKQKPTQQDKFESASYLQFHCYDYIEGKGKFKNGLGKFIGVDSDDRIVEVPWPSLTILDRQGIWHNRAAYIGKQLTFEYFERTPSGAYRFPRAKAMRSYE